jgi:PPOX class probable F420-dependent enzyme
MSALPDAASALLSSQLLCVLSTVADDGRPASALVGFSVSAAGEFVFGTSPASRKYGNLLRDPRVAIAVHAGEATLQVEGTARVAEGAEDAACRALHVAKNPRAKKYAEDASQRFVVVTPTWARFTDYGTAPPTVEESRP